MKPWREKSQSNLNMYTGHNPTYKLKRSKIIKANGMSLRFKSVWNLEEKCFTPTSTCIVGKTRRLIKKDPRLQKQWSDEMNLRFKSVNNKILKLRESYAGVS